MKLAEVSKLLHHRAQKLFSYYFDFKRSHYGGAQCTCILCTWDLFVVCIPVLFHLCTFGGLIPRLSQMLLNQYLSVLNVMFIGQTLQRGYSGRAILKLFEYELNFQIYTGLVINHGWAQQYYKNHVYVNSCALNRDEQECCVYVGILS